ncbi:MAG: transglutaminase domain-containing protein [Chloroflexi bacterium]|nr:transglutaminase domain-containing protein [Chloroflexota bacterium]
MRHGTLGIVGVTALAIGAVLPAATSSAAVAQRLNATRANKRVCKDVKKHGKTVKICRTVSKSGKPKPAATPAPTATPEPKLLYGTVQLSGTMKSTVSMTMTGAFSVGKMENFEWDLPIPGTQDKPGLIQLNGYTEQVIDQAGNPAAAPQFTFSADGRTAAQVEPTSFHDITTSDGHLVRRFHWDSPPDNTVLKVTETLNATISIDMTPFKSTASFPMAASSIPADVKPFLELNPTLDLGTSADAVLPQLSSSSTSEQSVVQAAADWVASNTTYNAKAANGPFDASWVLTNHIATCRGYDDILAGLLRKLGIPAQVQYGWVSAAPEVFPAPNSKTTTFNWSDPGSVGELHTWLNVWFPDSGWVPFDPQAEKFFVDARHIGLFTNIDAGDASLDWFGQWKGSSIGDISPTGPSLSSSDPNVFEYLPADGFMSQVGFQKFNGVDTPTTDYNLKFVSMKPDLTNLIMFSR